jgi:hypothetical protein
VSDFPSATRDTIAQLYTNGVLWGDNLEKCNESSTSSTRDDYLNKIRELLKTIDESGFFERADFTEQEQNSIIEAANEISGVITHIKAEHDLTLCAIETDLADLLQRIPLDAFLGILRGRWALARRQYARLPKDVPDVVIDAYNVGIFTRCEFMLNQRAKTLKPIAALQCLNSDDYGNPWFVGMQTRAVHLSSQETIADYAQYQTAKDEAHALAKLNEPPGIGGLIWSVIGWDDPWDFLKDMAFMAATGGAGKAARWAKRLNDVRKDLKKAKRYLRNLEGAIAKIEARMHTARSHAQAIKRSWTIRKIPQRIKKAIETLADLKKQQALIASAGTALTGSTIRAVITSVTANLAVNKQSRNLSAQATLELAQVSARQFLEARKPFDKIPILRTSVNVTAFLRSRGTGTHETLLMEYFAWVWLEEFIVRVVLAVGHQSNFSMTVIQNLTGDLSKPILSPQILLDEGIAALGAAVQRIWREDLSFLDETIGKELAEWVVSFGRKSLVELLQKVVELASKG